MESGKHVAAHPVQREAAQPTGVGYGDRVADGGGGVCELDGVGEDETLGPAVKM